MIDLIVKIIFSIIALATLSYLVAEGRLTFALAGIGVFSVAGWEIKWVGYAYRPNRTYWRLSVMRRASL
jgi:hypothetical protein